MADQEKLGEIYVQVSADVKKLNEEIKGLKARLDKDAEEAGKSFATKFGRNLGKFLIATGAITILSRILKKSVESFAAQELAENKLRTALGKTSQALLDQANALQKVTIYSDDSVINAQARIAAYTQDEEQVKKLTKATLDLAAGLGTDLEGASQLVAKTFGTSTNALMRQGVEVNGLAGSTERLHSIVQGITDLYGGQAENQAKTFSGRLEQMRNKVDDLQERLGKALIPVLEKFVGAMGDAANATEEADTFFQGLAAAGRVVGSVFYVLKGLLINIGTYIGTIGAAIYALVSGNFELIPGIVKDGFNAMVDNGKKTVDDIGNMWTDMTSKFADEEKKKRKIFGDTVGQYADMIKGLKDNPNEVKAKFIGMDEGLNKDVMYEHANNDVTLAKLKYGELSLFMQETNQVMLDNSMFTTEAIMLDWLDKNALIKESIDSMAAFTDGFFNQIRVQGEWANSMLEQGFASMADAFIAQVKRMAAEWLWFQILRGVFSVATGGAAAAVPVGHSGGSFIGTSSGVKKMAGGGSFIVPPGFPNDSYPLLVESGERVTVNPASQTGMESRLLRSIDKKLAILNSNTVEGQMSKSDPGAIPLYGKIENDAIYLSNKRASKLIGRMT